MIHEWGNFRGRVTHCKVYRLSAVSCAEMAEPIELPFGLWTRVGRRKHKCPYGRTHWHWEDTLVPHRKYDWTVHLKASYVKLLWPFVIIGHGIETVRITPLNRILASSP